MWLNTSHPQTPTAGGLKEAVRLSAGETSQLLFLITFYCIAIINSVHGIVSIKGL